MKNFFPSVPLSGGILLSYKCNATCKHCIYASSPRCQTAWIAPSDLERMLGILAQYIQAAPHGAETVSLNHGLHFTGGEPFLHFERLLEAVRLARHLGIPSLFVETNAFWCQHDDETETRMRALQEAGLSGLLVSVNPFILESVPFDRTVRAISLGSDVFGQQLIVYQLEYFMLFRRLNIAGRIPLKKFLNKVERRNVMSGSELLPTGRAVYTLPEWFDKRPAASFFATTCAAELQGTMHNHWDNYGNVIPRFCAGIALGNLLGQPDFYENPPDMGQERPLVKLLFEHGVKGLFEYAVSRFHYQEAPAGYSSKCHLCLDIRCHLVSCTQEFRELQPSEFYAQLERVREGGEY